MIHVSREGQQFGPYTQEDAQAYLAEGSLLATDLGWTEGSAEWVPLSQLVGGGEGSPSPGPGTGCPKCGAGIEADQVICLSCGHNVDDPIEGPEVVNVAPQEKRKVPPSLTYENEVADRSSFVNSVGWGLLMASLMPVFGDGQWNVPFWGFWKLSEWQLMFNVLAPGLMGATLIFLATSMHGRGRGVIIMVLALVMAGVVIADEEVGRFNVPTPVEDTSEPIPEPLKEGEGTGVTDVPEIKIELENKNVFYEKMDFEPDDHMVSILVFIVAWFGIAIGAKSRYYRIESAPAYIISTIGALAMIVFWFLPGMYGMPVMAAVEALSDNIYLGAGLLLMMVMQLTAAGFCLINTLGKRPSQMKKFANIAVMLTVTSIAMPVLPVWGKVIYEETVDDHARAQKRSDYVGSQFGKIWTGAQMTQKNLALDKVEKPLNAVIGAVCGWLMTGVKYVAWLGGVLILFPLGITEMICGTREQDEGFIVQQQ